MGGSSGSLKAGPRNNQSGRMNKKKKNRNDEQSEKQSESFTDDATDDLLKL